MCLQDAGSSQVGFLLGSCGVGLALTSEICLKGLPKTPTGEILQFKGQKLHMQINDPFLFKNQSVMVIFITDLILVGFLIGWPRLKWVVTDSKYLTKPSKDWQPHIPTANTDTAYIEVRSCACFMCFCVCVCLLNWCKYSSLVLSCSIRPVRRAQWWVLRFQKLPC